MTCGNISFRFAKNRLSFVRHDGSADLAFDADIHRDRLSAKEADGEFASTALDARLLERILELGPA